MLRSRLLLTGGGYKVKNSLRFNNDDSAYLSRTPASTGNRKTWTYSGWVKRGPGLDVINYLFGGHSSVRSALRFNATGTILFTLESAVQGNCETSAVFRDPSAHMHIVLAFDTTQATASNRVKLWVNNQLMSFASPAYPALDYLSDWNEATTIMSHGANGLTTLDGLLSEVNLIDGQALDPSYFGKTDAVTGAWVPKKYTGSFGTNGFYLDFKDATSLTTLGYDRSGNANHWTLNNHATSDQLTDTPTNNYCTWNPLDSAGTLSDGSLTRSGANQLTRSTWFLSAGKWYWEYKVDTVVTVSGAAITRTECALSGPSGTGNGYGYLNTGEKTDFGANYAYGASFINGDIIGVAFDADTRTIWFSKNGAWQNGATASEIASGVTTNAAFTGVASVPWSPSASSNIATNVATINFGQRPFAYTPPTGFKSLCTDNLPVPSIKKPAIHFKPLLYAGNSAARSLTGLGFQPDLVWVKNRSAVNGHRLTDSIRGVGKVLLSDSASAESTTDGQLSSFDTDGFSIAGGVFDGINVTGNNYVAWCFKKGVIPGFDTVAYAGDANATKSINHALGVTPRFVIIKNRSNAAAWWAVYHVASGQSSKSYLNSTQAPDVPANWLVPSATEFTVTSANNTNENGSNFVTYLFAEVTGFSRISKYTGNGSADGPFVWCGFRPRYVLVKRTDVADNWLTTDTSRAAYNQMDNWIYPNLNNAEAGIGSGIDATANGFKIRSTAAMLNASGGTYIFIAFAEHPFKYAKAA